MEQNKQVKSPRLKINLWKKIGKSQSFNEHDKCLKSSDMPRMSSSHIQQMHDYLCLNRMSKMSSNSSISDHVISEQQSHSKNANSSHLKSSTSIFDQIKAQGFEIKNIDDSESIVEEEQVIEESEFQSQFHKYQSRFKAKCLLQPNSSIQSGSAGYSESEQFSPLPPFIDPSMINSSSRHFSKIVIKFKQTSQNLSAARLELKSMQNLFAKFTIQFVRFAKSKDFEFQNILKTYKISKPESFIQAYLNAREPSMIMEEDESHLSFSVKKSRLQEEADLSGLITDEKDLTLIKPEEKLHAEFQSDQPNLSSPYFKENTCLNLSEDEWNQMNAGQRINALCQVLSQKSNQIEELKNQMVSEKAEYLQYKNLFGETNKELNAELDTMAEKLKTEELKYEVLEQEFIKLKQMVHLKSSLTKQNVKSSLMKSSKHNLRESHMIEEDCHGQVQRLKQKLKNAETENQKLNEQLNELQSQNERLSYFLDQKNILLSSKTQEIAQKTKQLTDKTQELIALRQELEDHLVELPVFKTVTSITQDKKKLKRSYSFGLEQLRRSLAMSSGDENEIKKATLNESLYYHPHQAHSKINTHRDELLKLKEEKLKEYEKQIQTLVLRENHLNDQIYKLEKELQIQKNNESSIKNLREELQQTNRSIAQISQIRSELQQSNQKLYEHIFDLEQTVAKTTAEYAEYVDATDQTMREERIKYEQAETMSKELLQKIDSINHASPIHVTQFPSTSSLNQTHSQNLMQEINLYKKLYEDKKSELEQIKRTNAEKRHSLLVNEEMQKETDKFRIEALKENVMAQEEIIRSLQQNKEELLQRVKELSKKLAEKEYCLEKLNIELKKSKANHQNLDYDSLNKQKKISSNFFSRHDYLETAYSSKKEMEKSLEISLREQFLRKKEEQLHKAELKIQSEQRKLQLTKNQIESKYQTLLLKYQNIRTAKDQSMNRRSLEHLLNRSGSSRNHKRSHQKDVSIYPFSDSHRIQPELPNRSGYVLTSRCQSPEQNTLEAQRIINDLRSRQHFPTSDREPRMDRDIFARIKRSPDVKKILSSHNTSNATELINKIRGNSPKTHRVQSPKRIEQNNVMSGRKMRRENDANRPSQQKKLKLKLIEQKMKKLKQEVRDSIKFTT